MTREPAGRGVGRLLRICGGNVSRSDDRRGCERFKDGRGRTDGDLDQLLCAVDGLPSTASPGSRSRAAVAVPRDRAAGTDIGARHVALVAGG
jgi:hypothetical protein